MSCPVRVFIVITDIIVMCDKMYCYHQCIIIRYLYVRIWGLIFTVHFPHPGGIKYI